MSVFGWNEVNQSSCLPNECLSCGVPDEDASPQPFIVRPVRSCLAWATDPWVLWNYTLFKTLSYRTVLVCVGCVLMQWYRGCISQQYAPALLWPKCELQHYCSLFVLFGKLKSWTVSFAAGKLPLETLSEEETSSMSQKKSLELAKMRMYLMPSWWNSFTIWGRSPNRTGSKVKTLRLSA